MESSSFLDVEQETPSPAPAPVLVQAEKVSKYNSSCTLVNGILKIKVVDNTTNVLYIKQIDYNSSFWSEYGKYFQNDIKKLYDDEQKKNEEKKKKKDKKKKEKKKKKKKEKKEEEKTDNDEQSNDEQQSDEVVQNDESTDNIRYTIEEAEKMWSDFIRVAKDTDGYIKFTEPLTSMKDYIDEQNVI